MTKSLSVASVITSFIVAGNTVNGSAVNSFKNIKHPQTPSVHKFMKKTLGKGFKKPRVGRKLQLEECPSDYDGDSGTMPACADVDNTYSGIWDAFSWLNDPNSKAYYTSTESGTGTLKRNGMCADEDFKKMLNEYLISMLNKFNCDGTEAVVLKWNTDIATVTMSMDCYDSTKHYKLTYYKDTNCENALSDDTDWKNFGTDESFGFKAEGCVTKNYPGQILVTEWVYPNTTHYQLIGTQVASATCEELKEIVETEGDISTHIGLIWAKYPGMSGGYAFKFGECSGPAETDGSTQLDVHTINEAENCYTEDYQTVVYDNYYTVSKPVAAPTPASSNAVMSSSSFGVAALIASLFFL